MFLLLRVRIMIMYKGPGPGLGVLLPRLGWVWVSGGEG